MDAFWCITLGIIIIRAWWKHQPGEPWFKRKRRVKQLPVTPVIPKTPAQLQREADVADLKRQGYTDETIAIILPVINN